MAGREPWKLLSPPQDLLKPGTALVVDTGDSTYRTFSLPMPEDSQYEVQLMYGSIGYATPAGLGLSHALRPRGRRVITITGEGAFHLTANEIGNAAVYGSNAIYFCVNNNGYLIERILAPTAMAGYNFIKRWDHCKLVEAMLDGEGDKVFKVGGLPPCMPVPAGGDAGAAQHPCLAAGLHGRRAAGGGGHRPEA